MPAFPRLALFVVTLSASAPAVVAAQGTPPDSLLHRIQILEARTLLLEQQVQELAALIKTEPVQNPPVKTSKAGQDLANWRQLRIGMSMKDVRALLGEPTKVVAIGMISWYYPKGASVRFYTGSGDVAGWVEPDE